MAFLGRFLLASLAVILLIRQYAPGRLLFHSATLTAWVVVNVELSIWVAWHCLVYPHYLSPLRHLPGPSVRSSFLTNDGTELNFSRAALFLWANSFVR